MYVACCFWSFSASGCFVWLSGADGDAERLSLTDQLFDGALGELRVVALDQPYLLVGDFNVEPTKIPCLSKGISAGLWVDLESSWAFASGVLPVATCKRAWGASGGNRKDFMVGCPLVAAAVSSCSVQQVFLIMLLGLLFFIPAGLVRFLSLFGVRPFGLLLGCRLWIRVGSPSLSRLRGFGMCMMRGCNLCPERIVSMRHQ